MRKKQTTTDIVIIGGGHSGLLQTLLLAQKGFNVICIDRDDPKIKLDPEKDGRTTAISFGSHRLMKAANIWTELLPHACPINDIQILDGSSPVLLDFHAADMVHETNNDQCAFGWIIENHVIYQALYTALAQQPNITHLTGINAVDFKVNNDKAIIKLEDDRQIEAKLVIGADGRQSFTREWMSVGERSWSYDQQAIVCAITHKEPHNNIAVEHFKAEGPFAILPMLDDKKGNHRSALVWTQHGKKNASVLQYNDEIFTIALNNLCPDFYGEILDIGKRYAYPLNFVHAYDYVAPRMALIADAAHGIHPIAGQGLNLGLRDVAALTELLAMAKSNNQDIGDLKILKQYQQMRRPDNMAMAITTDLLNKLFSNDNLPVKLLRKIGLKTISHFNPAKKFFMRQAMGASGHLPKIIRNGKI